MKNISLILIFVFLSVLGVSQPSSPGYMGKKFTASIDMIGHSWLFFGDGDLFEDFKFPAPDFTISGDYIIAPRKTVGISLGYSKYKYQRYNSLAWVDNWPGPGDNEIEIAPYAFSNFNFWLNYTVFYKGRLAPLGPYTKMSLIFNHLSSEDFLLDDKARLDVYFSSNDVWDGMKQSANKFAFQFSFGNKFILYKDLTLDLDFHIRIPLYKSYLFGSIFDETNYEFMNSVSDFQDKAFSHISGQYLNRTILGFSLRLGYMF